MENNYIAPKEAVEQTNSLVEQNTETKKKLPERTLKGVSFFRKSKIKNNKMFGMGLIKKMINSVQTKEEDSKFKSKLVNFYNSQVYSLSNKRPFLLLTPRGKLNCLKIAFKTIFMFNQIKENIKEYGTDREIQIVCKYSENQNALFKIKEKLADMNMLKTDETSEESTKLDILKQKSLLRHEDKLNVFKQSMQQYNKKDTATSKSPYLIGEGSSYLNAVLFFKYFLLCYSVATIPLLFSLFEFGHLNAVHPMFYIESTASLLYLADLMLNLLTATEEILTVRQNVKKKVKRLNFALDLVSLLPFALLLGLISDSDDFDVSFYKWFSLKILFLAQTSRIVKYSYFPNSFDLFYKLQSVLGVKTSMLNFAISMAFSTLLVHIFGCLWIFSYKLQHNNPESWSYRYDHSSLDNCSIYFQSVYFSASVLFTVGYGDLTPFTNSL